MRCPKCGREMTCGAPHGDDDVFQWECLCGHIIPVSRKDYYESI